MKINRLSRFNLYFVLALLFLSTRVLSVCVKTDDLSGMQTFTLYAGQHIVAGTVSVEVNGDNLDVTYNTTDGWELVEVHMWTGRNLSDMPQTRKGNPIPGKFPHSSGDIAGETSFAISVPMETLQFACPSEDQVFKMAAHAALRKENGMGGYETQTGWSEGTNITDKGSWATYSSYTLTCSCNQVGGPSDNCETAFAWSAMDQDSMDNEGPSVCFITIDADGNNRSDFNRWGWSNGPLLEGIHSFQLWAAAGQCDLNKGTMVGSVTVNYDGVNAVVSYQTNPPYTLSETHAYVGNEILPKNKQGEFTVAPGQYPQINDQMQENATSDTYQFDELTGEVYTVFHATVCGMGE